MITRTLARVLPGVVAVVALGRAAAQEVEQVRSVPISVTAPIEPTPVRADDGKWYLVYNLFLWNWSFSELQLEKLEIFDGDARKLLVRYDQKDLAQLHRLQGLLPSPASVRASELRRIPSGRTAALFVGFTLDASAAVPARLTHRFSFADNPKIELLFEPPPDPDGNIVLEGIDVAVDRRKPIVIGPPLRGGPWKCSGGIDNDSLHQHQTTLLLRDGKARIPERFALDFQKIDEHGDILPSPFPDDITNEMFYSYGEEAIAVADAVVSFVQDGIPENVPQANGSFEPAVPITAETVSGNQVALDLGDGHFAFYAHLQPGSLRVKRGERVRRGQVLGLVGNAGNATGPHLHFHVGDRNSLNGCEGLPFVFDAFEMLGHWPDDYKPEPSPFLATHHELEFRSWTG